MAIEGRFPSTCQVGLENGLPAAFDLIAAALDAFDAVLEALETIGDVVMGGIFTTIRKWTGEVFIKAIEKNCRMVEEVFGVDIRKPRAGRNNGHSNIRFFCCI